MIGDLLRFAVVHLGASVIAGLLVAGAVLAIARLLDIRDARVRSWLLGAAVVKATLVFLGLASLLHLPAAALDLGALPPSLIAPLVLAWAGTLLVLQGSIVRGFHHGDPADGHRGEYGRARPPAGIRGAGDPRGARPGTDRHVVPDLHRARRSGDAGRPADHRRGSGNGGSCR
jgi:hypothetical protein